MSAIHQEIESLRRALVTASEPLVTLRATIGDNAYPQMSDWLQGEIVKAADAVEAVLERRAA